MPLQANEIAASARISPYVELRWATYSAKYVGHDVSVGEYVSAPELEVTAGENTGNPEDKPWEFKLLRSRSPVTGYTSGFAHPLVSVTLGRMEVSSGLKRPLFRGTLSRARGRTSLSSVITLSASSVKSKLATPLGYPMLTRCPWTLGDAQCRVVVTPIERPVTSVLGTIITMGGVAPDFTPARWETGSVEVDGLRIGIASNVGNEFTLFQRPPLAWEGATATWRNGCRGDRSVCVDIYNNESQFGGIGIRIPAYNPTFKSG